MPERKASGQPLRLFSHTELAELPPPRYLVQDMIRAEGLNVIFGPSGAGKTFYALDQSLCVASGLTWYGQEVEQGLVIYVAAEGAYGLHPRLEAWQRYRGIKTITNFRVWPEPVNLFRGETTDLNGAIGELANPPALIVFDTLPRCMVGGDENSARDMGLVIHEVDQLRRRYGCAVSLITHTGKNGDLERGSSALRGAADTIVSLKPYRSHLQLRCEKQKDGPEFEPWKLHLERVADSVSLRLGTPSAAIREHEAEILGAVSTAFGTDWMPTKAVREAAGLPKSSAWRALKALCEAGFMEERSNDPVGNEYRVTFEGMESVPDRSKAFHETGPTRSVPHSSLRSGTGQGVKPS
jgi:hypothetical protein